MFNIVIPTPWALLLADVQQTFPGAVLGGGALRDLAFGLSPDDVKDLDFFADHELLRSPSIGGLPPTSVLDANYVRSMKSDVCNVFTYHFPGLKQPVQVVTLFDYDPYAAIARMDYGGCQLAWDGQRFYSTASANHDITHRRLTLCSFEGEAQIARSVARGEAFKEKLGPYGVTVDNSVPEAFACLSD